ncbi:oxidoreductase [Clostridia bacterium]|nr:oxidoreductase [Clostridia bacterium]
MAEVKIPNFDLTGKVAIITGGTKGLGYNMAHTLAAYGADVVVASRTAADCERVAKELEERGIRALGVATDVRNLEDVKNLIQVTVEKLGKLDIMINDAGVGETAKLVDMTEEQWDKVNDTDLKALVFCAREAAKQMIAQGGSGYRIINISSAAGVKGTVGIASYNAAKAGVIGVTKTMCLEWSRYGITINAVCPGYVRTEISQAKLDDPVIGKKIVEKTAIRRVGEPEEISAAVLYLASGFSGYMTGTHLLIDGGGAAG